MIETHKFTFFILQTKALY